MRMSFCLSQLAYTESLAANFTFRIRVERFTSRKDEHRPFHLRAGKEVFRIADRYLPDNPVFVLSVREVHRLHISLTHNHAAELPVEKLAGIEVLLPNGRSERLATETTFIDNATCEAAALLDPCKLEYSQLLELSPWFGDLDEKYVPVDLVFSIVLRTDGAHVCKIRHRIYCKIVKPGHRSRIYSFFHSFRKGWERCPQWMRDGVKASVFCANVLFSLI